MAARRSAHPMKVPSGRGSSMPSVKLSPIATKLSRSCIAIPPSARPDQIPSEVARTPCPRRARPRHRRWQTAVDGLRRGKHHSPEMDSRTCPCCYAAVSLPHSFEGGMCLLGGLSQFEALGFAVPPSTLPGEAVPARPPLPVISAAAVAVLAGLALGIGLGSSADHPQGGSGVADPSSGGDPGHGQSGGDLPPMDFEGKVPSTSSRTATASPTGTSSTTTGASAPPVTSEPQRADEVTSAVGVTPTPDPSTPLSVPEIPEGPVSSLVETPLAAPAGT